jgi:LPS-assembly protein
MLRNKASIFLIFYIFIAGTFLLSQEAGSSSEPITIIANYKEKIKELVFATGSVEIHYKDIKLFADKAELNTETKDVYAVGNVLVQMPEEVVSAEEIRMNLDSGQGKLQKGFGMIQPTIFYEAENIERKGANVYSFQKPKITSCTQPVPRWKLTSSRANFKRNDYIEMWNAVFSIKKIPIFYLPYMRYPLDEERSTGFLMPQLGYAGSKGFSYTQSYYWAMKRNMDATLSFDYYSARGLGGGLEYRYLFSGKTGGQLNLYYFNFKDDPAEESSADAYLFRFKHNQPLPLNFSLVADIDYSSSFDFLREFDNDFKRAVVSNRRSQVYLTRAWSYFNLNARVSRFETYYKETDRSIIRNEFPEISFDSYKIKIFSPLYFSFRSSLSSWEYGWESEYEQGNQRRSQSLAFSPKLTFPFAAIPWMTLNSSFSSNINYYFQSYAQNTQEIVDEPIFSHNYGFNAEFIGPVIYKIYYGKEGKAKLKHIIEPTFTFRYESPVADSDRIITQRIFYRNHYIRYGITNRFLIKKGKMPKEVFTLGLAQTFYFSPDESPLQVYRVDGKIPEFTDISGYLRFYPARKYSLDVSAAFNPYHSTFSSLRLGANLGSPTDNAFLRVNWYKSVNPYDENVLWNRHQIGFFAGLKLPELSLETQAEADFNIQEGKMLYSALALVYNYQCLDFRFELKIFYFREKPETQFLFSFGLGNIGKTIDFLGGMGF